MRLELALAGAILISAAAVAQTAAQDAGDLAQQALELVNDSREERGLTTLEPNAALGEAARHHAHDMLERDYYAHESPEGETVADRFRAAGGSRWALTAENIARCDRCDTPPGDRRVESFHAGWMDSPGHRRNILAAGLTGFGFAVAAEDGTVYAVQTFAGPGTPRGDDPGDDTVPLGPQAARMALLDRINAARDERDAAPLRLSEALSAAAADLLPEEGEGAALAGDLSSALPDGSEGQWRALNALATACGGCGREMTEADLAGFMDRWLAPGGRGEALLAERFDAVGAAFHATGDGRKSAVVVLGVRRETP